jgi:hypothetical protein
MLARQAVIRLSDGLGKALGVNVLGSEEFGLKQGCWGRWQIGAKGRVARAAK